MTSLTYVSLLGPPHQKLAALPCSKRAAVVTASSKEGRGLIPLTLQTSFKSHQFGYLQYMSSKAGYRRQRLLPPCQASIEDPEMLPLVKKMDDERPTPPANRELLDKAITLIDAVNVQDPTTVDYEGQSHPYRLLYSKWLTEWVKKLDPKARDELLILARGRNVESWQLKNIDRNNFPPNLGGVRMWQAERRNWQANRLTSIMKEAGYEDDSIKLVEEVMMDRDIPDPQDIRQYDLKGPLGTINYRLLEEACMIQTLRDAEALVFMEKNFPAMAENMSADEVLKVIKRELALVSLKCIGLLLDMPWSNLQRKLVTKAFPTPRSYSVLVKEMEGVSAASTHPGDWRYRGFDYD